MGIEINLTTEDIDQLVKDSIMKAGFGKAIEMGIQRAMAPGYDNPIDKSVKAYILVVCDQLLREQFSGTITRVVTAAIEVHVTDAVIKQIAQTVVEKVVRDATDF